MHWPFQAWAGSTMSLLRPSGPSWECWASSHRCITGNSCLCGAAVVAWAAQPGEPRLHQLQPLLFALFPLSQYMTHRNRQGRLERGGQLWNAQQAAGIVSLLCSMHARAAAAQQAAARGLAQVLQQLELHHGITREQVGSTGMGWVGECGRIGGVEHGRRLCMCLVDARPISAS